MIGQSQYWRAFFRMVFLKSSDILIQAQSDKDRALPYSDQFFKIHIFDINLVPEPVIFFGDVACILKKNKDTLCCIIGTADCSS